MSYKIKSYIVGCIGIFLFIALFMYIGIATVFDIHFECDVLVGVWMYILAMLCKETYFDYRKKEIEEE